MAIYYADSSVLVKRHAQETGTSWVRQLTTPATGNTFITSILSEVEILSALNRKVREGHIQPIDYRRIATDVIAVFASEYQIISIARAIIQRAESLVEQHPLKAYDAMHLAVALETQQILRGAGIGALTFLASDRQLLNAAQRQGLTVDDPLAHP